MKSNINKLDLPFKKRIILYLHSNEILLKDPNIKSYFSPKDLINILNNSIEKKDNIPRFLYHYKNHLNNLFGDYNIVFENNSNEKRKELSYFFYSILLIEYNNKIVNNSFLYKLINISELEKNNDTPLKNIIILIIYLQLINNFGGDEKDKERALNILKNNINNCKDFKLILDINNIQNKKIDKIYIEIINELIISNKFHDLKYIYDIMKELDLENIHITKLMFDELYKVLNSEKNYIKDYIILNKEDLFNEKKINFYYNLLNYILKSPFYIYHIPFLLRTRNLILKLIKSKEILLENIINDKLEYILKNFFDLDYYFNESQKLVFIKLNEILIYYKTYLFESKKEEIEDIENIIINKKGNYKKYLKDYDISVKMNNRNEIIVFTYKDYIMKKPLKEKSMQKYTKFWGQKEKMILDKKLKKMRIDTKEKLMDFFDINNEEKILKIFDIDSCNFLINTLYDNCIYDNNKNLSEKEEELCINEEKLYLNQAQKSENDKIIIINLMNRKKIEEKQEILINQINSNSSFFSTQPDTNSCDFSLSINHVNNISISYSSIENKETKEYMTIAENILNKSNIQFYLERKEENSFTFIIINVNYGDNNIKIDEYQFRQSLFYFNKNNENPLIKNYIKFIDFLKVFELKIKNNFKSNYKLGIKLKFKKIYENQNENDNIYNIDCIYIFYELIKNKILYMHKDENILVKESKLNYEKLLFMKLDINIINKNEKNNEENKSYVIINDYFYNNQNNSDDINKESIIISKKNEKTYDKILFLKKIIKEIDSYNGFIIILNNDYFITKKSDNIIAINDYEFNEILEINYNISVNNIILEKNDEEEKKIKIILYGNNKVYVTTIDLKCKTINNDISSFSCLKLIKMENDKFILISQNFIYQLSYNDLINNKIENSDHIENGVYKEGIKLNENTVALVYNSLEKEGNDIIIFYDINLKIKFNYISGYSFTGNDLSLMNNKFLLCSCSYENKNGILLINIKLINNIEYKKSFYNFHSTDYFVPTCFCPILKINNNNIDVNNIQIEETNYFYVGGNDLKENKGKIKLYKIIYENNNLYSPKIKYVKDIEIEDNENIENDGSIITSIVQSRITGNIAVGRYNGIVTIFNNPFFDF